VKTHSFSAWQFGRRLALGAITLVLVFSASDRSGAASSSRPDAGVQASQPNATRGQGTPSHPDASKPNQPRVPWWKDPAIIKEISLTPDQSSKIDAIWRKRQTEMHGVATEQRKQEDEFKRLLAERKVGVDVIGLQFDRSEALRSMLEKSRTMALYQTSLILSAEQNQALKAIGERNRRR
jgi:hypothetical protein